jgi:hypothetical protein
MPANSPFRGPWSPPCYGGLANRVGQREENSPANQPSRIKIEHLPEREGVGIAAARAVSDVAGNRRFSAEHLAARQNLGDRSWGQPDLGTEVERPAAQEVLDVSHADSRSGRISQKNSPRPLTAGRVPDSCLASTDCRTARRQPRSLPALRPRCHHDRRTRRQAQVHQAALPLAEQQSPGFNRTLQAEWPTARSSPATPTHGRPCSWLEGCKACRRHSALGGLPPISRL